MKSKRWAVLVMGFPVLGLLLFLVLPFRTALFLYAVVTGLASVLARVIEAKAALRWVARRL